MSSKSFHYLTFVEEENYYPTSPRVTTYPTGERERRWGAGTLKRKKKTDRQTDRKRRSDRA